MQRINTTSKAVDLFGAGKHGFKDGDLGLGIVPTDFDAAWFNALQEEVCYVVEQNGITLDGNVRTQLYQAIQAMIAGNAANDYKASVRFTTTGNIVLSGLGTQAGGDWGAALTAGDRIFPKDQATASDRTIWIAAAGAWTRATDADGVGELTPGAQVTVEEGATLADSTWELTTDGPIIIGTTALTWARQGGSQLDSLRIDVASAATVNLTSSAPSTRHIQITGTTGIGAFTVAAGLTYFARFAGSLPLINGAGLVTQTSADIVTQAGDTCILRALAENVVEVLAYVPAMLNKQATRSMVRLNTANGHGSTSTKIRRFANTLENKGSDITYADSATLGGSFTINTGGIYAISYCDNFSSASGMMGVTLNTSAPTSTLDSVPVNEILCEFSWSLVNYMGQVQWTGYLPAGSVLRAHTEGSGNGTRRTEFTIVRVG